MMLQVGFAADYKSRAQTAADAAALAGGIEVKREIIAAWAMDHQLQPEEINMALVCAQAAIYAERNGAHITSCRHDQYDILVDVVGRDSLDYVKGTEQVDGDTAKAKARATPWGFGGGGGGLGFGGGGGSLPVGGGGGGSLMGANPALKVYADVAAKFGLQVTSGLRPGDSDSYHGSGNAIDVAAPMTPEGEAAMLRFAQYAAEHWGGQLEELIHTPLGYGIKNGVRVPLSFWGSATNAEHFNHVHIADTDPPKSLDDAAGPAKSGVPVGSAPSGGFSGGLSGLGGGAFGLRVHLVRYDGGGGRVADIAGVPDGVPDSLRQVLFNIMICESGGDPHATEAPGGNGGPLGHYGLFQFDIPTWESVGGHGDPRDAPPEEQWMRAVMLYQRRGLQPWECAGKLGYI
jgi:Transglycosylase-like domain